MNRRAFLLAPVAAAWASRYEKQTFPDWDQKLIDQVVSDSPWARTWKGHIYHQYEQKLMSSRWTQLGMDLPPIPGARSPRSRQTGPVTPAPIRIGVELIVRWATALPVRRAMALQQFGRSGLESEGAKALLAEEPKDYIIELAGVPHLVANEEFVRQLQNAKLSFDGRRPSPALSAEVAGVGTRLHARLTFPRAEQLTPDSGTAVLTVNAGGLKIEEEWKLRSMIYEGKLEL